MKTDALSTKNALSEKKAINFFTDHLRRWTQRELRNVTNEYQLPLCWAFSSGDYLVGRFYVKRTHNNCWPVYDQNKEFVHNFGSKKAAIFYCLCLQVNQINLAGELLKRDNELTLLEADCFHYKRSLIRAKKINDEFKEHVWGSRYYVTKQKATRAQKLLEKTLKSAKYLEIWEKLP